MVAGDAPTDDSLFKLFPASVLVQNPNLPQNWRAPLKQMTRYESDLSFGQGFAFSIFGVQYIATIFKLITVVLSIRITLYFFKTTHNSNPFV